MLFVLDASVAACWVFEDEDHSYAAQALARIRTDEAHVPSLWWFEVRNTLLVNERRGRLTEIDTAAFLRGLSRLRSQWTGRPAKRTFLCSPGSIGSPSTMPLISSWRSERMCPSRHSTTGWQAPRVSRRCR